MIEFILVWILQRHIKRRIYRQLKGREIYVSFRAKLINITTALGIVFVTMLTFFVARHNRKILIDNTLENNREVASAISINSVT